MERCIAGDINRLVISLPPRYLKSLCVTAALPAFLLGHDPTRLPYLTLSNGLHGHMNNIEILTG